MTPFLGTAAAVLPEGYPKDGCWTLDDPSGDGYKGAVNVNDDDLDLRGLAVNTTDTDLKAYLKVTNLAMPSPTGGHLYSVTFTTSNKTVELAVGEADSTQSAVPEAVRGSWNTAKVDAVVKTAVTVTATFDKNNDFVVISAPIAQLATALGTPFAVGTQVINLSAGSAWVYTPNKQVFPGDTVTHTDPEKKKYTLGTSPCFPAPPGVLSNVGVTSVQYTDAAAVAAKLTNAGGTALAAKSVTFTIGSKSVTATTGADGIARAALNPGLTAGTYTLVTKFAGDSSAGEVTKSVPFTVTAERTRTTLSVRKSGTSRTVTAKVLDDDGRPVVGQAVTFYVNGKRVSVVKTTSAGTAVLKTAKPTQTVKAVFSAVSGKYLTSSAQMKV
jgi:hypothetical protein